MFHDQDEFNKGMFHGQGAAPSRKMGNLYRKQLDAHYGQNLNSHTHPDADGWLQGGLLDRIAGLGVGAVLLIVALPFRLILRTLTSPFKPRRLRYPRLGVVLSLISLACLINWGLTPDWAAMDENGMAFLRKPLELAHIIMLIASLIVLPVTVVILNLHRK